jgi:eukaryotic-like serine/threonine-protein kinase
MLSDVDALIGHVMGKYVLERVIGRGGTGAVFFAHNITNSIEIAAVKVLIPPPQTTPEIREQMRQRFDREIATLQRLHHPHIVKILAYGQDDATGLNYMAMPYYPDTLANRMQRTGQVPLSEAQEWLRQMAEAIDYAHREKIIHRDIKPENILIDDQGQLYLSDFGIAMIFEAATTTLTMTGQILGTPVYMAPEQGQSAEVGPEADIYSLGMVMYQAVTGQVAFQGTTPMQIMLKHINEPPRSPQLFRIDLPDPAAAAILKALAKQPSSRFPSAHAFAQSFAAGLQNEWEGVVPTILNGSHEDSLPIYTPTPTVGANTPSAYESFTAIAPWPSQMPARAVSRPSPSKRNSALLMSIIIGVVILALGITLLPRFISVGKSNNQSSTGLSSLHQPSVGTTLLTYHGHPLKVYALAWSPDCKEIASGGYDTTAQVWDANSGDIISTYRGHTAQVYSVTWSPDSSKIVSGSFDATVQMWDASTGKRVQPLNNHSAAVYAVAWSPDGKYVASAGYDQTVQVSNANTGEGILTYDGHSDAADALSWSPDSNLLATASWDDTVKIIDMSGATRLILTQPSQIYTVAWSPNGQYIASAGENNVVYIWDAITGQIKLTFHGHTGEVFSLSWSHDGRYLASASQDHTVRIWDTENGNSVFVYQNHTDQVRSVAWSRCDGRIASAGWDSSVQIWQGE